MTSAIGIDTHKDTLAACRVDGSGADVDERTFANDPAGHRALRDWVHGRLCRAETALASREWSAGSPDGRPNRWLRPLRAPSTAVRAARSPIRRGRAWFARARTRSFVGWAAGSPGAVAKGGADAARRAAWRGRVLRR